MEITRRGSTYNYGKRTVSLSNPRFSCENENVSILIKASNVKDFTGESHHDYTVALSSDEIIEILNALAVSAMEEPEKFEMVLSPALKSLIQLGYVTSGTVRPL